LEMVRVLEMELGLGPVELVKVEVMEEVEVEELAMAVAVEPVADMSPGCTTLTLRKACSLPLEISS